MKVKLWSFFPLAIGLIISSCGESLLVYPDVPGSIGVVNEQAGIQNLSRDEFDGAWDGSSGTSLEFKWYPSEAVEAKAQFLNTGLHNGTASMNINITGVNQNTGNAGFMFRATDFAEGQDKVTGYYIGIGRDNAGQATVEAGRMEQNWNQIWAGRKIEGSGTFNLAVTMIDDKATVVVKNNGREVFRDSFYDMWLAYGDVGIRTWQAVGTIDNLKITNVGPGFDH